MKPHRKRTIAPAGPGLYVRGGIVEGENELTVGQPPLPYVELTPAGPPCEVIESESDDLRDADELSKVYPDILRIAEGVAAKSGLDPKELADETVLFLMKPLGPMDDGPCVSKELLRDLPRIVGRVAKKLRRIDKRHAHGPLPIRTTDPHQPDPALTALAGDLVHQVLAGIAKLDANDQAILHAYYFNQRSIPDIARETGREPSDLRARLRVLHQELREMLRQEQVPLP